MSIQPDGTPAAAQARTAAMNCALEVPWTQVLTRVKFALGDRVLLSICYEGATRKEDFLRADAAIPAPRLEEFPAYAQVLVYPAHPITQPLPRFCRQGRVLRYVMRQYERQYIDLSGTFEQYMAGFSAKSRSTIKRKVRKFQELSGGAIDWRQYRTLPEVQEFYRIASPLSERTYQERLLKSGLPQAAAYKEGVWQTASQDGIRAYLLFHEAKPVAYLFTSIANGVLKYDYLGYDPQYAQHSPGTVLQVLALQSLFEEGCHRAFDFGEGQGQHKELFATGWVRCADILFMRATPRNCLVMGLHAAVESTSVWAGNLLQKLGLKSAARRLIRR